MHGTWRKFLLELALEPVPFTGTRPGGPVFGGNWAEIDERSKAWEPLAVLGSAGDASRMAAVLFAALLGSWENGMYLLWFTLRN